MLNWNLLLKTEYSFSFLQVKHLLKILHMFIHWLKQEFLFWLLLLILMNLFLDKLILMKDLNSQMFRLIMKMLKEPLKELMKLTLKKIKLKGIKKLVMMILLDFLYGSKINFNHMLIKLLLVKKKFQDQLLSSALFLLQWDKWPLWDKW